MYQNAKSLHGYGSVRPSTCCSLLQLVFMDVHLPLHLVSYYRLDSLPWKKHHWNAFHKRISRQSISAEKQIWFNLPMFTTSWGLLYIIYQRMFLLMSTAISTIFLNNINFQNLLAQINCLNQCTSFLKVQKTNLSKMFQSTLRGSSHWVVRKNPGTGHDLPGPRVKEINTW